MVNRLSKRFLCLCIAVIALVLALFAPVSVASAADEPVKEITVFSWEDYIDLGYSYEGTDVPSDYLQSVYSEEELTASVLEIFEKETGIKVNYYSFATNEEMYNELVKNPNACDIICPSEYMILKMRQEGLIKPYTVPENYELYGSPYIKQVFEDLGLNAEDGKTYAIGYMWGTMGLIYNMEKYSDADFQNWSNLYDEKFKGRITIKDSLRDSYIMTLAIVHEEELLSLKEQLTNNIITETAYKARLAELFNDTAPDTVEKVGDALIKLKNNLYGFEVDAGKSDLLTGKIDVNFAWSGDAVYSMWEGDEIGVELGYAVPEEGSNVWFDGWVMTKNANEELASQFLNYVSDPHVAVRNIDYVGYTSCVSGNENNTEVFDYVIENFSDDDGDVEVDLKYFFDPTDTEGNYVVNVLEENRRYLYAQYADEETIMRCVVMDNFEEEDLVLINEMWNKVKLITLPSYVLILITVGIILLIAGFVVYKFKDKIFDKNISSEQTKPRKKGYKVVKIEEIKH